MEQPGGPHGGRTLLDALVAQDLNTILDQSSERLLTTIWGSGPAPNRVPRSGLAEWFGARDALTDEGFRTRVLGTLDGPGTAVALLLHAFEREGQARSYETVDEWTFRSGKVVAWFSRPIDVNQYGDAWGLRRPRDTNRLGNGAGRWQGVGVPLRHGWPE
jgi:hypothetical protein